MHASGYIQIDRGAFLLESFMCLCVRTQTTVISVVPTYTSSNDQKYDCPRQATAAHEAYHKHQQVGMPNHSLKAYNMVSGLHK